MTTSATTQATTTTFMLPPASKLRAEQWCQWDPNPLTAKLVQDLLQKASTSGGDNQDNSNTTSAAKEELLSLFPPDSSRRIGFGTAGLRSAMEPGPLNMNDLVVLQTAQGIARYCQHQLQNSTNNNNNNDTPLRVVIGYDHRSNPALQLSSLSFAVISALVFVQAGIECILLDGVVHTPLVAFATTYYKCAAGIMVTASHNPARDNGYKVYWKDGCQIRPPLDTGIAQSILENLTPWVDYGELVEQRRRQRRSAACDPEEEDDVDDTCLGLSSVEQTQQVKAAYYEAISNSGLVTGQAAAQNASSSNDDDDDDGMIPSMRPSFVYTAMHGVGLEPARRIFEVFGLPPFHSVPSQEQPDPMFPTVTFPNPEEEGALDIAKDHALNHNFNIVLANDPDADRLAVAEYDERTKEWIVFTGDQIGTMLGHWLWESVGKKGDKPVAMCASTVSSKMLSEIARVEGFRYEDTLTGFKWIGSRLAELAGESCNSLFGYEEAIGFCCGDVVHDKDGITAMAVFAELAYSVYGGGRMTLSQHMQSLYDKYGEFVSKNGYFFCYDPSIVVKIIDAMRNGGKYMEMVGPYKVQSIRDLGTVDGYDSTTADKRPTLPTSTSSPMMTIVFENGCVAQFRASGTEPKLKYYVELKGKPLVPRAIVEKEVERMSECLLNELLRPEENGLVRPN